MSEYNLSPDVIERIEVLQVQPDDVIIVSLRENTYLTAEASSIIRDTMNRVFPDNKVLFVQGMSIEAVRSHGGEKAEADGAEGVAGESGEAAAE